MTDTDAEKGLPTKEQDEGPVDEEMELGEVDEEEIPEETKESDAEEDDPIEGGSTGCAGSSSGTNSRGSSEYGTPLQSPDGKKKELIEQGVIPEALRIGYQAAKAEVPIRRYSAGDVPVDTIKMKEFKPLEPLTATAALAIHGSYANLGIIREQQHLKKVSFTVSTERVAGLQEVRQAIKIAQAQAAEAAAERARQEYNAMPLRRRAMHRLVRAKNNFVALPLGGKVKRVAISLGAAGVFGGTIYGLILRLNQVSLSRGNQLAF